MFQKYILTYGTYDTGDIITMVRYSTSLEEALEDAQTYAHSHFEDLARKKQVRWKHYIGEYIEEYRNKVKYLTGIRPVGGDYKGQSFWNLGYNKYKAMLDDHIWYQAELVDIKNPFEEL